MDIAILAAARFPIGEPFAGGMEMHTHVLADALHHRGHDVTVYAADGVGPSVSSACGPVTPSSHHSTATSTSPRSSPAGEVGNKQLRDVVQATTRA